MTFAVRDRTVLGLNVAGGAACAAVVAVFWMSALRPMLGRASAAVASREQLATARQQRDAAEQAFRSGTDQLDLLRRHTAATALVLLPASRVNDVLSRISTLSAGCGVRVIDVRVGHLSVSGRYATVPVHAVGRGTYGDCVRFLHQLNHDCPDVGVAAFALAGTPEDAGAPVSIDLDLRWHAAVPVGR